MGTNAPYFEADTIAEERYNTLMEQLQEQDAKLQERLDELETQKTAVEAEMESIKETFLIF